MSACVETGSITSPPSSGLFIEIPVFKDFVHVITQVVFVQDLQDLQTILTLLGVRQSQSSCTVDPAACPSSSQAFPW